MAPVDTSPISEDRVVVFVDPSCPFAWITYCWLTEVERASAIQLTVRLLSLAVVNEHRDLDDWYRTFNNHAWAPARVMAAITELHDDTLARAFYEAFGERFHVLHGTGDEVDRRAVAVDALADAGLSETIIYASDDGRRDERLRTTTKSTLDRLGLDVGVPLVEINEVIASGPVLTAIPGGQRAADLYQAVRVLTAEPGFVRLERPRIGDLQTTRPSPNTQRTIPTESEVAP